MSSWARVTFFWKIVVQCWNHKDVAPVHVSLRCIHFPCPTTLMRTTHKHSQAHVHSVTHQTTCTGAKSLWFQHPNTFFQPTIFFVYDIIFLLCGPTTNFPPITAAKPPPPISNFAPRRPGKKKWKIEVLARRVRISIKIPGATYSGWRPPQYFNTAI